VFAAYISKKLAKDVKDIIPDSESEFERYKDLLSRSFAAFDVQQPYAHCTSYSNLMVTPKKFLYSNKELRDATEDITLKELKAYSSTLWSSGKGIALVQGNIDQDEAETLISTIDKALDFQPITASEFPPELSPLPLPSISSEGQPTKLVVSEPNPENANAASYVMLQCLSEDPKEHVLIELLSSILAEHFYEDLRTKQQLGYIVSSGVRGLGKTRYIGFVVQSSIVSSATLSSAIVKFLDEAKANFLEKVTAGDFAVYVKSLIEKKAEPDKQLATEVTRNWGEIGSGRFEFDRPQKEIVALLDLKREELVEFWDDLYVKDGRRVLITEVVPCLGSASSAAPPMSTGYKPGFVPPGIGPLLGIDDIETFRNMS
jgi:secreted Zn-dependent insulinase-like peptidase